MDESITKHRYGRGGRKFRGPSGPRCPICHSYRSRSFSSIYGYGTTEYRSHRGLILPTHFQKTRRQSIMARKCSPPARFPWWPAIVALVIFGLCRALSLALPRINDLLLEYGYWALWAALALGLAAAFDSYVFHPRRMEAWSKKRLCDSCGTVFVAEL